MPYTIEKWLPKAEVVLQELPLAPEFNQQVTQDRIDIKNILEGKDDRKIMIIGPCSAWPSEAVLEYAEALKPTVDKVSDKFKIILRTYLQKPRTTTGWLGPVNQPNPFETPDLEAGTIYCRKMMIKAVEMGYALADEALFTHNDSYFVDLLSWVAIGARSAEDQEHRIFASMIDHPVGLKNPTSGNISIGINSVIAAQHSHVFAFHGKQIRTDGNEHSHLILRGGNGKPNYDIDSLNTAVNLLEEKNVLNPSVIVDASHDNSLDLSTGKKDPLIQGDVIINVLECMKKDEKINKAVKGFMVESFLKDGNQNATRFSSIEELEYGKSITDGCMGIEKTKEMLLKLADMV